MLGSCHKEKCSITWLRRRPASAQRARARGCPTERRLVVRWDDEKRARPVGKRVRRPCTGEQCAGQWESNLEKDGASKSGTHGRRQTGCDGTSLAGEKQNGNTRRVLMRLRRQPSAQKPRRRHRRETEARANLSVCMAEIGGPLAFQALHRARVRGAACPPRRCTGKAGHYVRHMTLHAPENIPTECRAQKLPSINVTAGRRQWWQGCIYVVCVCAITVAKCLGGRCGKEDQRKAHMARRLRRV